MMNTIFDAASQGDIKALNEILNTGINIDSVSPNGFTPLYLAILNNKFDAAEFLIMRGADVDFLNVGNSTALEHAIFKNDPNFVRLLLRHGANVNGVVENNPQPRPPICMAIFMGYIDIVQIFLEHDADLTSRFGPYALTPLDYAKGHLDKEVVGDEPRKVQAQIIKMIEEKMAKTQSPKP